MTGVAIVPSHKKSGETPIVAAVIALVTMSFGLGYGHSNHNSYLIEGLTKLEPGFLANDWFASEAAPFHPSFAHVVYVLGQCGSLAWNTALVNAACTGVSLVIVWKIAGLVATEQRLAAFLLAMFMVTLENTSSVGDSYLFSSYLQPSSLAAVFAFIAVWCFLRERVFSSGLALAAAGYFHTNFLLLGIGSFMFAHCLLGPDQIARRLTRQLAGSVLLFVTQAPFLMALIAHPNASWARELFFTVRSPHHYVPATYLLDFLPFVGWHVAAIGALATVDFTPGMRRRFVAIYFAFLAPVVAATALTTIVFVPFVAQLYVWRLAPFSVLFAQLLCAAAIARRLLAPPRSLAPLSTPTVAAGATGASMIAAWYLRAHDPSSRPELAMAALAAVTAAGFVVRRRLHAATGTGLPSALVHAVAIALLAAALYSDRAHTIKESTLWNGFPGRHEAELYAWVEHANANAIFTVPPDLSNFRLHGRRAIVVDWKSIPVDPAGVIEWHARLAAVSGVADFRSRTQTMAGYRNIDLDRMTDLATHYGATHLVRYTADIADDSMKGLDRLTTVYRNETFEVKAMDASQTSPRRQAGTK